MSGLVPVGAAPPEQRAVLLGRLLLLILISAIAAGKGSAWPDLLWLVPLAAAAVAASITIFSRGRHGAFLLTCAESALTATAIAGTGGVTSVYLPYLLAPAVAGALLAGVAGAVIPPGVAAGGLLLYATLTNDLPLREFSTTTAQWVVLAALAGLVVAWVQRISRPPEDDSVAATQRAAYELLKQLQVVARRLPGSLNPTTTAEGLLLSALLESPPASGVVLVRAAAAGLTPLTSSEVADEWDVSLAGDHSLAEAWATQEAQPRARMLARHDGRTPTGSSLVVPITSGRRSVGLLALESERPAGWTAAQISHIQQLVADVDLQLELALLFDELRTSAIMEERQRLAREIHDGIAQELVFLGYALDNAAVSALAGSSDVPTQIAGIRAETTRIVDELRLSMFDLRTHVDPLAGLGSALSDHVRAVGSQTGMTVHLRLNEASLRLPVATEVELLRIAQEAVANARKHSRAHNLWISCTVQPPAAELVVEDDGVGFTKGSKKTYGLGIMEERAARIRAELTVHRREPSGTTVRVSLPSAVSSLDVAQPVRTPGRA